MRPLRGEIVQGRDGWYLRVVLRRPTWRERLRLVLTLPLALFGVLGAGSLALSRVAAGYALDIASGRNAGPGARTVYLALLTVAGTATTTNATMTELSTSGYARQACAWGAPSAADPPVTSNTGVITFGPFTADPPNVPYFAIVSSSSGTGGDFLMYGTWALARDVGNGDSLQVAVGGLSLSESDS